MSSIVAGEGKGAILNAQEERDYSEAIDSLFKVCASLKQRGRLFAAQMLAKTGQKMARQRYTKGMVGYRKFDEFLND